MQPTPKTVSDHCLIDAPLPYTLVPKVERDAAQTEGREVLDDGNKADSAPTIAAIGEHNRVWRDICQRKN